MILLIQDQDNQLGQICKEKLLEINQSDVELSKLSGSQFGHIGDKEFIKFLEWKELESGIFLKQDLSVAENTLKNGSVPVVIRNGSMPTYVLNIAEIQLENLKEIRQIYTKVNISWLKYGKILYLADYY